MSERLLKLRTTVPAEISGTVLGQLSRIGGWIDGLATESNRSVLDARIPVEAFPQFKEWLAETSEGRGEVQVIEGASI